MIGTDRQRVVSFAFLIVFSFALFLAHGCDSKAGKLVIGKEAPNFIYFGLDGQTRELKELRGKVVFLRFWADWCPHCAVEMPIIEKVYQEMKDRGLIVIAVNVKQSEPKVRAFISKFELSYPIALDQEGRISDKYEVKGLPVNYVINRQGILKELIVGSITDVGMLKEFLAPYF
jgi:cytochrome c biogenesis protein CcmG, thiol:disulfide interchange protein DsbE